MWRADRSHGSSAFGAVVGLLTALTSCSPAAETPLRSPSQDYPHSAPTTSDGEVVGADGVAPADRLQEGPSVGTESEPAPGWKADEEGVRHDPKARSGGATDQNATEEPRSPHTR